MMNDYNVPKNTVIGTLKVAKDVYSPQLDNERDILVWLPESYGKSPDKRYPVLYMHDGQNIFDEVTSYVGEWEVDETLTRLGVELIVVGIPNNEHRVNEYNPYDRGEKYIAFITDTVKPLIDTNFRTLHDREHTGIAGSSMGGLISTYAYFHRPDIFSYTGSFSPAYWTCGDILRLIDFIKDTDVPMGKIYQDVGTGEDEEFEFEYTKMVRDMDVLLQKKGYEHGKNLMLVVEEEAIHNEGAWARRFPDAIRFLVG